MAVRGDHRPGRVRAGRASRPRVPREGRRGGGVRSGAGRCDRRWSVECGRRRSVGSGSAAATGSADATDAGDVARESNEYLGPVVEYEYRAGAQRYANDTVWPAGVEPLRRRLRRGDADSPESVVERFPEGEPVAVYHDPEDASLVPARNWTIPVVCSVFVVALTVWAAHCTGVAFVPVGEFDC